MFTGIIEQVGVIKNIDGARFVLTHDFTDELELGESVACNGACMTVVEFDASTFAVDIITESRNVTTFKSARVGDLVNLERSAIIGQRNSGHNVTGHIDQVGVIQICEALPDQWRFRIGIDSRNRKYLVYKGSIAIDGISLTISAVSDLKDQDAWFEVSIIPHTFSVTNLQNKGVGQGVNLEFDQIGKYILNARL